MDSHDELFNDKLALMCLYYPDYSRDALGDLLRQCRGDIDATRAVIGGPRSVKRRGLHQGNLGRNIRVKLSADGSDVAGDVAVAGTVVEAGKMRKANEMRKAGEMRKPVTNETGDVKNVNAEDVSPSTSHNVASSNLNSPGKKQRGHVITLNTPRDVETHLGEYASLHPNFFSPEIADQLLDDVATHTNLYKSHEFYLFGNYCVSNHGTGAFCKPNSKYPDLIYNGLKSRKPVPYSAMFGRAVDILEAYVNDVVIPSNKRLPFQRKDPWTGNFCAVNYYQKLQNNLEWHSDRLSHIGPHNYIASVSLGSTRMFRLRRNSSTNGTIYQIPLTHNSLLMMKPGCQEKFKHCVNSMSKALEVHPTVGTTRYGLTFRCYDEKFLANLPKCKCNMSMTLRRSYKAPATRGRYFWSCENSYQNKDCGTFHWADFSNIEGHYIAKEVEDISTWVGDVME